MIKKLLFTNLLVAILFANQNGNAQADRTFNGTTDALWSTATNWSDDTKPVAGDNVFIQADVTLDEDISLRFLRSDSNTTSYTLSSTGGSAITFNGDAGLYQNKDALFIVDCKVIYAQASVKNTDITGTADQGIKMGSNSTLQLDQILKLRNYSSLATFEFDGVVTGAKDIRLFDHAASTGGYIFGVNADLSAFTGNIEYEDNGTLTVNTAGVDKFIPSGSKLYMNDDSDQTLILNGANSLSGELEKTGTATSTIEFNSAQTIGSLDLRGTGTLIFDIDNLGVNTVEFSAANADWETASVKIQNFADDKIKFPTLSAGQLAQITLDPLEEGFTVAQRVDGFLYKDAEASVSKNTLEGVSVYPNPATDAVNVEAPNNSNVSIYDATGVALKNKIVTKAVSEISLQGLTSGIYFVKIENAGKTAITKLVIN
ncbi:T9SS type A sorting domain-containing protein [Flavicella marina]|uniref:T9SS type A sorting domain-containing protein n=1 Tax=Flavicella marina TaxID=1475951 RepID=UPI001265321E|nr:T9SS type A sorting domain-containing protein [Flavicella marina]